MKLATYQINHAAPRLGVVQNNHMIDLEDVAQITKEHLPKTMLDLIDMGLFEVKRIQGIIDSLTSEQLSNCSYPLSNVTFLAPIPKPRKNIIGIGLNYTEHVAESARTLDTTGKLPQKPIIFSKPPFAGENPHKLPSPSGVRISCNPQLRNYCANRDIARAIFGQY